MIQESNENNFLATIKIFVISEFIQDVDFRNENTPRAYLRAGMGIFVEIYSSWKVIACELRLLIQLRAFFFSLAAARCSVRRHIQNKKIDFFPLRMLSAARTLVRYIIASVPIHLSLNQLSTAEKKLSHMFACWQITRSRNKDLLRLLHKFVIRRKRLQNYLTFCFALK